MCGQAEWETNRKEHGEKMEMRERRPHFGVGVSLRPGVGSALASCLALCSVFLFLSVVFCGLLASFLRRGLS